MGRVKQTFRAKHSRVLLELNKRQICSLILSQSQSNYHFSFLPDNIQWNLFFVPNLTFGKYLSQLHMAAKQLGDWTLDQKPDLVLLISHQVTHYITNNVDYCIVFVMS